MGILDEVINNNNLFSKPELFLEFLDNYNEKKCKNIFNIILTNLNSFIDLTDEKKQYNNSVNSLEKINKYKCIINDYKNFKKNDLFHPGKYKNDNDKNTFSASLKKDKDGNYYLYTNPENVLERLIKISINSKKINIENQIPIPDKEKASHIDLVKKNEKNFELIELKQWDNDKDTPLWAIVESIKNLYMYIHYWKKLSADKDYFNAFYKNNYQTILSEYDFSKVKKCKLTILAPFEYYKLHFCNDNNDFGIKRLNNYIKLCKTVETLVKEDLNNNNIDVDISILTKYFNFTRDRYNHLIGRDIDNLNGSILGDYIQNKSIKIKIDKSDIKKSKLIPKQNKKERQTINFDLKKIFQNEIEFIGKDKITKQDIEDLTEHKDICELFK